MRPLVLSAAALALGLLALLLAWTLRDDAPQSEPERRAVLGGKAVIEPIEAELATGAPFDAAVSGDPRSLRRAAQGSTEPNADAVMEQIPTCLVRVVDDAGTPLAGASVFSTLDLHVERATTDVEGCCAVARPGRDQRWRLFVELEGHFHVKAFYVPGDERTITLHRTRRLAGRVVDAETEAPLADALVRFGHNTCKRCEPDGRRTDGAGSFTFESLPVAYDVTLLADAQGYAGGSARFRIDPDAESAPCILRLEHTRRVELYVFDALTRAPVASARLMSDGPTSGADGLIALELARSDVQPDIWVAAPGYLQTRGSAIATSEGRYEVPLVAGATLTGVVRFGDGAPIEGATVMLRQDHSRTAREGLSDAARFPEATSGWNIQGEQAARLSPDATGSYVAQALVPCTFYSAHVRRQGFGPIDFALPPTGAPGSTTTADIVIERPKEVRLGRWTGVTRKNGAPLESEVTWQVADRQGAAKTDAAGHFTVEDIPIGPVTARVQFGDRFRPFPLPQLTTFEVVVPASGVLERDLDIVFETRTTTGRVRTPDGAPLAAIGVVADGRNSMIRELATTDDAGVFSFDLPVVEGVRYRIGAMNAGVWEGSAEVDAGATSIELTLPRAVRARVRVLDANGKPLKDWDLNARSLGATQYEVQLPRLSLGAPTADGWYEVKLPEGDLELEARAQSSQPGPGQLLATARERLVSGERAEVELVVESR